MCIIISLKFFVCWVLFYLLNTIILSILGGFLLYFESFLNFLNVSALYNVSQSLMLNSASHIV